MLNGTNATTNLDQDAISTFRRMSTGSASVSPASSPAVNSKMSADVFRTPHLPKNSSTNEIPRSTSPSLKRKIDQVDPNHNGPHTNGKRERSTEGTEVQTTVNKESPSRALPTAVTKPFPPPRTKLDLAYHGKKPLDELSTIIKRALMHYLTVDQQTYGKLGLEIEAKLGHLTDRDSGQRMHECFPIASTTLIHVNYPHIRFESNMTEEQHSRFNKHLNEEVEARNPKHPRHHADPTIRYEHTKLTDSIYEAYRDEAGLEVKPRVTTSDKDGSIQEIISKQKITHLHISCPDHPFDVRLSINIEHKVPAPTASSPTLVRKKDRLSYKLQTHRIDLTKVGDKSSSKQSYELEIELTDVENLKRMAEREVDGEANLFDEVLLGFLGTVFALNKTAGTF